MQRNLRREIVDNQAGTLCIHLNEEKKSIKKF